MAAFLAHGVAESETVEEAVEHEEACCSGHGGDSAGHSHQDHTHCHGHGTPAANVEAVDAQEEEPFGESVAAKAPIVNGDAQTAERLVEAVTASDVFCLARQQNFVLALNLLGIHPHFWTSVDDEGHTLCHWAALVDKVDFVQLSLQKGVSVDSLANNKQTPLMWATLKGNIDSMKVLIDAKANLNIHDSLGATPFMIAIQHRQYTAALLLMHRGNSSMLADFDKNGCTAAHWAAYKGDETSLRLLDFWGADILALDSQQMMPLHRAVSASQACVVKFLVERRSDPAQRTADGRSCIDIAMKNEDSGMQMLLKRLTKSSEGGKDVDALATMEEGKNDSKTKTQGWRAAVMKDKSVHLMFPVFWLVCVSLATFQYLTDLRMVAWQIAPMWSLCFEVGVPLSLASFAFVALSDPGKIPTKPRGQSGVEELMRLIDAARLGEKSPDISRLCTTTWILKDLRTKYCTQTGACVRDFDHYCIWLNTAIGRGNHRQFVLLAVAEEFTQISHLALFYYLSTVVVPYETFASWLWNLATSYPLMLLIMVAHTITAPWVFMLIVHQARLISQNLTTNEMMNMHRYDHFWKVQVLGPGRVQKVWHNPFHKGSVVRNFLDFFWTRRRSELGVGFTVPVNACKSHGCQHHHH